MHAIRRRNLRLVAAIVALAGILGSGWLLIRDSDLVAVQRVEVTGASGAQRDALRDALTTAGREMTTLHVRRDVLERAVAPYAVVAAVAAEAELPSTLRVRVTEHVAVATLVSSESAVPVAADGTVLRGTTAKAVPALKLRSLPGGERLTDPRALGTLKLLARAPEPLRRRATNAFHGPRGLTVQLDRGPSVHFGSGERLTAKWASLTAVLAGRGARHATAIDVRVPEHPAAAGLEQESTQRSRPST